ncbi:NAD(P)-dependent oxidoreductase [Streptomyces sp. NBC_01198]|uniref:NAD(P)-dependent oxidoreductase n=1 Tax=Streptomyces sp. NBC_01198 TaxID=2903769 RepID=UPI002E120EB9|nr:NAD(P)H-binding protein [Streptomyces sp. NBC_01198]
MHITVFGAAGAAGRQIVAEGLARGHRVDAVVRSSARLGELPAGARGLVGDALSYDSVVDLAAGRDVVITATRPAPGREAELVAVTEVMLPALAATGGRLLVVGGAGTLTLPGGGTVADAPDFPAVLKPIADACADQLARCRAAADVDWTYLSPAALLQPGERTGRHRLGGDELVADAGGVSALSYEDLAVVLLDEAEQPRHRGRRFTAAY